VGQEIAPSRLGIASFTLSRAIVAEKPDIPTMADELPTHPKLLHDLLFNTINILPASQPASHTALFAFHKSEPANNE
jgi:hypothetical protein